jgi:hypothetical protein
VIGASSAELKQRFSNTLERRKLGGFVAHDSTFAYLFAAGFELRLHQNDNSFLRL